MDRDSLLKNNQRLREEITKLKAKISELENTCRWLNMIYRSAWEISESVCGEGQHLLAADEELFVRLYDRMQAYDDNQDLRERFEIIEKL